MLIRLARFIRARSKATLIAVATVMVLALGILDLATGVELSSAAFYLIPIALVSWHVSNSWGAAVAVASAIVWLAADLLAGHIYTHPLIPYWNMLIRLGFFLPTVYLLGELKSRGMQRRMLERIFFHDILNVATGIRGFAEVLRTGAAADAREIAGHIETAAEQVIGEIETQRDLSAAEQQELRSQLGPVRSRQLLEQVTEWYRHRLATGGKTVVLAEDSAEIIFESDPQLLSRVLGNMLKNALEAVQPGETVTAGCRQAGGMVEFWVHNPQHIPPPVQATIFRRAFSTKGADRGLGTYSMRLLSHCLKGEVSFSSSRQHGTTFRARYPLRRG